MLLDSITDTEAIATLQAMPMATVMSTGGVGAIVTALREPFGEEIVLRKGSYMDAYEYLERKDGERGSYSSGIQRWRRS